MADKRLIRVVFEYEDSIDTLEDRCQEWIDEVNGYVTLQAMRTSSRGMSLYDWKSIKKESKE